MLLAASVAVAAPAKQKAPPPAQPAVRELRAFSPDDPAAESLTRKLRTSHAPADTKCAACHTVDGWQKVSFPHERTGFPLEGAHAKVSCQACHATGDFNRKIASDCRGCHRDAHAGELGSRCAGCHDVKEGWKSRFDADAHRRTNFPLLGRHAAITCEECHPGQAPKTFARNTLDCVACHQKDYDRTRLSSLDHASSGFDTNCKSCHSGFAFRGAAFPQHDRCFQLTVGPHAGIRCKDCHTQLTTAAVTGACGTNTASCIRCHSCASTDRKHQEEGVPGYQCKDRKCYECHRFTRD